MAVTGDFNGDGLTDVATEVYGYVSQDSTYEYAISVVLSNSSGTFQAPVMTPITDTCAALFAADVNNDGKADLVLGHEPNNCANSNTQPTFDVWLSNGDGTFTASANTQNTISATGVAGGTFWDMDGDGNLDIVLVDDGSPANVITLLGNGDGTFRAPSSVALSGEVGGDAILADLNGDGLLDIADDDYNSNQLTVYLATSATTYASAATYDTGDHIHNACSITIGDISGDGKPEIVNTNCSATGQDFTVYVNNGDGTFQTGVYYNAAITGGTNSAPVYVEAEGATIADVNGDGKGDIISTNYYSSDVTILFGNSDGSVSEPTFGYAIGSYETWAPTVVADFNGDGWADIIVPDDLNSLVYLRGYGDGTFRSARNYYAVPNNTPPSAESYGVATGDLNGDGYADFVVGNACNYVCTGTLGITVFLSNPDGSYQSGITLGNSSDMWFSAIADFDGDGKLDIAATDWNAGTVQIFTGDGKGNFTAGTPFDADAAYNAPYGIFVADFNKDGHPDLAVANYSAPDISILLNDGSGNFQAPIPLPLAGSTWQGIAIADLNNDGKLDIVAPYWYGSAVAVLIGVGDGTFLPEQDVIPGTGYYPNGVALGDFDGNGTVDIAMTLNDGAGQDIAIASGNGDGTFSTFSFVPSSLQDLNITDSPNPQYIQAVDIDGDGKLDLVYNNSYYGTVGILFGQGNGSFFDPAEYPVGQYDWALAVSDVNGDGAPDVVTANYEATGGTVLFNNNGSATLGAYTIHSSAQGATVAAGSSATFTLTITPTNHYNGTITFTCPAGLPAGATCSFSPSSVKLDGLAPVTVKLTITTTGSAASSLHSRAIIDPQDTPRQHSSAMLLASLNGIGVFGMVLAGSLKKRTRQSLLAVVALGLMFFLVACGGSVNSRDTIATVTSSSPTASVGQTVTFTGKVISPSGFANGSVTFLDGNTTLGTATLSGGSATFQTSSLAAGVHSITISYAGDSRFHASTSAVLSQTIGGNSGTPAGTYAITVSGAGSAGTNGVANGSQTIKVNVTVQ